MKSEKNTQLVAGLRELAEFIETNDDFEFVISAQPTTVKLEWRDWYLHNATADEKRERITTIARKMGNSKKIYTDSFFFLQHQFGPHVLLEISSLRETVCERVVTGNVLVPAEPEHIIPAKPERLQEKVEWKCRPILDEELVNDAR